MTHKSLFVLSPVNRFRFKAKPAHNVPDIEALPVKAIDGNLVITRRCKQNEAARNGDTKKSITCQCVSVHTALNKEQLKCVLGLKPF